MLADDDDEGWKAVGEKVQSHPDLKARSCILHLSCLQERPRLFEKDAKITVNMVMQKFGEVCMQRGKKAGQRYTMVDR